MNSKEQDERLIAWLRLTYLKGVGPILVKRLLAVFGSPDAILNAHPANLAAVEGIGTIKANQLVTSAPASHAKAVEALARVREHGFSILPLDDEGYPPGLKTVDDPPIVLFVRGGILPADAVAVGMVGARKCTFYGREQAQRLGMQLAQSGLTIVSGGARGIDTCSHLGALQAGGRTIVVTGCGLLNTYPPENDGLYERIVKEGRGAIVSELPLDAPPSAENFPPRNRIIAGMSLGIVVVEANLQSGSLITARLAAADYGREVFALPGRVDSPASSGTHHLIKTAAAHLVESADDILGHLGDVGRLLSQANAARKRETTAPQQPPAAETLFENHAAPVALAKAHPSLTSVQEKIVAAIGKHPATVDDIVDAAALPAQVVVAELTLLQIHGMVRRHTNNRFVTT
ncbi:MAG TPA: DNA-processing protein DprA [Phycisphaerae bacterium]